MAWEFVIGIDFPPNLDIEVGTPSLPFQRWLVFGPFEGGNVVRRFGTIRYAEPVTFGSVTTVGEVVSRQMWFNPTIINLNNQVAGGTVNFLLRKGYGRNQYLEFYREVP